MDNLPFMFVITEGQAARWIKYAENGDEMSIQILGIGHCLPDRVLNNADLEKIVDTSDQWIMERTGIRERRIAPPEQATSDLCYHAALMALERAGIGPEALDLIIVGTTTPDMPMPSTACILQEKLGAWNAGAFDMEAGCTGFVYGLTVAEKFLGSAEYNYVLVLGADLCSRVTDYTDRNTCVIFGDGAGAAVLGKGSGQYGFCSTYMGADGRGGKHLSIPGGGSAFPATIESVQNHQHYIKMNGNEIFKFAVPIVEKVVQKLMDRSGLELEDVDCFVPHQANTRIIKSAVKRCGIPMEKTLVNIEKYGNMSAACIPIALSEAEADGRVKAGDLVLMVAFGGGLTFGGVLMRWGKDENVVS